MCEHEHDHGHEHGGHGHSHEVPLSAGPADSLYTQIDVQHVIGLNARGGAEAGKAVIKSWDDRDDETRWVESDTDDSLILQIPFISSVSIRSITLKAGPSGQTPSEVRLFRDRPGLDFSDVESSTPTQVLDILERQEPVEYQTKAAKFAGVTTLTLFFPGNTSQGDEDTTKLFYIGLRGSWKPLPGKPGVIIYESAARPTDHKLETGVAEGGAWGPGY
ncbi:PITH domain-domain-containing protein [Naematelia encephala]|uniref:PITH domain-domain-containing protein n=1 Tax=Naematelia encephala TaxID=71784 RepID=A0A1Y2BJE8_9TREE|nr:PITH domain-domain-containing protein [Naematelia encephala]